MSFKNHLKYAFYSAFCFMAHMICRVGIVDFMLIQLLTVYWMSQTGHFVINNQGVLPMRSVERILTKLWTCYTSTNGFTLKPNISLVIGISLKKWWVSPPSQEHYCLTVNARVIPLQGAITCQIRCDKTLYRRRCGPKRYVNNHGCKTVSFHLTAVCHVLAMKPHKRQQ